MTAETRPPKVALVSMPWATTTRPSLALGILASLCHEASVDVVTLYPNMDMAAEIGFEAAGRFANERALYGLSEHLFACDLFGAGTLNSDDYLEVLASLELPNPFRDLAYLHKLRDDIVPAFLTDVADRVLAEVPSVLGLSATFNQVMASLALARRVKQLDPGVQVLAGGACFDGEMGQEYHRALPGVLDHVFLGEAENSFREYLRRHVLGEATTGIPGVTWFRDGELHILAGQRLEDMNQSPVPDYDDFFVEKKRLEHERGLIFNIEFLPYESSRGCWWGQHKHCVFCGINDDLMNFREKSVDRTISEMMHLASRYRVVKLTAADWIISRRNRGEIFRRLKELDFDLECFYETRADLSKEEVSAMRDAGIVTIQPGIESLSTDLLQLMRKGTTRIRHVQFLRWCREFGIHLSYNILGGFPGEQPEWYFDMAAFVPRIAHLQPPLHNMHYVEMHRFSPLFEDRDRYDIDEYQLREDYQFNFPPGMIDPLKVGYFFSYRSQQLVAKDSYEASVKKVIGEWIDAHDAKVAPRYDYKIGPGFLHITDTRQGDGRILQLADLHHDVVLLCDKMQKREQLRRLLEPSYPAEVAGGTLDSVIDELVAQDVLMEEGEHVLTLPIGYKPRTTRELYSYVLGTDAVLDAEQQLKQARATTVELLRTRPAALTPTR